VGYDIPMIAKLAKLANLEVKKSIEKKFSSQFDSVVKLVSKIQKLDFQNTKGIPYVLMSVNVLREDEVDESRVLSQKEALSNAKKTYNNYFLVDAILNPNE